MAKRKPKNDGGPSTPPPPPPATGGEVLIGGLRDPLPEPPKHLEDVLIAIQKSFSRVSAASSTAIVGGSNARALITGTVDFDLTARFDLTYKPGVDARSPGRASGSSPTYAGMGFTMVEIASTPPTPDQLRLDPNGAIQLHLKGTLCTDVRAVASGTTPAPSNDKRPNETGTSAGSGSGAFEV